LTHYYLILLLNKHVENLTRSLSVWSCGRTFELIV